MGEISAAFSGGCQGRVWQKRGLLQDDREFAVLLRSVPPHGLRLDAVDEFAGAGSISDRSYGIKGALEDEQVCARARRRDTRDLRNAVICRRG